LLKNKKIILQINYLVFLDCFDVLMSKINLYKKNIILMHFQAKNTLKNNLYHTLKHLIISIKLVRWERVRRHNGLCLLVLVIKKGEDWYVIRHMLIVVVGTRVEFMTVVLIQWEMEEDEEGLLGWFNLGRLVGWAIRLIQFEMIC